MTRIGIFSGAWWLLSRALMSLLFLVSLGMFACLARMDLFPSPPFPRWTTPGILECAASLASLVGVVLAFIPRFSLPHLFLFYLYLSFLGAILGSR